jgi:uncharacterized protein YdeI (YjbR/CyaY-like superfamily)
VDGEPIYFEGPAAWRAWLEEHHATETEVWVGMYKARTGKATLKWAQAVREALCFGWIDGIAKGIDDERHKQRFTPRKSRRWSAVNVRLVAELEAEGLMRPAGRAAFEARDLDQVPYSTSDRPAELAPEWDARLRAEHPRAAAFWATTPPSYRKTLAFWLSEAKRPETRERRFAEIVECSERGERLARFTSPSRSRPKT